MEMNGYELRLIPEERPQYNPKNGRFLKGHTSFNKGKTWNEFMSKRGQRRARKGWKNLEKFRPHGCPGAGRNKRPVIAVMDDGTWKYFPFIAPAGDWIEGSRENVGRCCRQNALHRTNTNHRYKGVRFYFEDDNNWLSKINNP